MTSFSNDLTSTLIPPHHPHYWRSWRLAFASIKALERAIKGVQSATLYICSGYDEDGEPCNIRENIAPFDDLVAVQKAAAENPNVVLILEGQKRLHLLEPINF